MRQEIVLRSNKSEGLEPFNSENKTEAMPGRTIVAVIKKSELVHVPAAGGVLQPVADAALQVRRFPQALPVNDQILLTTGPRAPSTTTA